MLACVEDDTGESFSFFRSNYLPPMCLKPLVKVIMAHESFIVFCVRDIIFTAY